MSETTPNLGLVKLDPSQSQPEVKINDAWDKIDASIAGGLTVEDDSTIVTGVRKIKIVGGSVAEESDNFAVITVDSSTGGAGADHVRLQLSCSDLATALTTGTGVAYLRSPVAFTLSAVRASLQTVSSSGAVSVDIKKNGSTILSTALSIDASEKTSTTAATPAVISTSSIGDDDEISIDITGAGTGAKGLIVTLIGSV